MAESNFIDYVKILCRSGKGGAGSRHFYRAKYIPKGGPDGGDGGRGGHIILRGNKNMWTLLPLKYQRHVFAGNGSSGTGNRSSGKDGEDKTIEVPCGTVVFDAETGEFLCEVTNDGEEIKLLKGGRGGLGNWHFKSATNQTPRYAQPGEPAIEKTIIMELKLLADVGLVGFPNAGKSTLLSAISAARPKIADYPFTTLVPNLGVVKKPTGDGFVIADIPGIIEGAHQGVGLGFEFLKHVQRCRFLIHVVDISNENAVENYHTINNELKKYSEDLSSLYQVILLNKTDILDSDYVNNMIEKFREFNSDVFAISCATGDGVSEILNHLYKK